MNGLETRCFHSQVVLALLINSILHPVELRLDTGRHPLVLAPCQVGAFFDTDMEQNRLWHEPVVEIYANAISPGVSCSAQAYDLANRRWYELNVGDTAMSPDGGSHDEDGRQSIMRTFQVPDDEWLSSTVVKHVSDFHKATDSPPTWNIINTTSTGQPVTFGQGKDNHCVGMPISERFFYGHNSSNHLPTIKFKELKDKAYLSRGADYCDWEGIKCVFKRIEFDCDNESHENEIHARERLIQHINQESTVTPPHVGNEMMKRFNIVPILGVVLHDETSQWMVQEPTRFYVNEDDEEQSKKEEKDEYGLKDASGTESEGAVQQSHIVAGFITPYMGRSLELLGASAPSTGAKSNETRLPSMPALRSVTTTADIAITIAQLLDLIKGVRELSRCEITHGDICYWNIIFEEPEPQSQVAVPRLLLIDMGDTAPDYDNDAVALASVLLWCLEHSTSLFQNTSSRNKVIIASALLNEGDFDGAIGVMSPPSVSEGICKAKASDPDDVHEAKRRRL